MNTKPHKTILVMGICGSGKTTIGSLLAQALDGFFLDADSLHPPSNVNKMATNTPLTDDDRWPWLDLVSRAALTHKGPWPMIVACSALKQSYRDRLNFADNLVVYLSGEREILRQRLTERENHFMPETLLDSQLEILEPPDGAINISIKHSPEDIVSQILRKAKLTAARTRYQE